MSDLYPWNDMVRRVGPRPGRPGHWARRLAWLIAGLLVVAGCSRSQDSGHRMLILGIDGMDPVLLRQFMEDGTAPNLRRLAEEGSFRPLGTSVPPQSPVAWSCFITGLDPGGHGIFDFIHRTPADYLPYLSTTRTHEPTRKLQVGKWQIPLGSGSVELLRDGQAFWERLTDAGVETTVVKVPANYPPVPSKARTLSGMGTPDILGTYGTFSYYTDQPP
ncbi:MAG: alkaline phosphatase family protein, partial [Nitrospirota bacterium]